MSRAQWAMAIDNGPSLDEFTAMAEAALAEIPPEFKRHIDGVALRIDDWPDEGTLRRMRIAHRWACSVSIAVCRSASSRPGPW